jgi:glycosyltransferase involved in cell wall biosynthesis
MNTSAHKKKSRIASGDSNRLRVLLVLGTLWGENGVTSHLKTLSLGLIQEGIQVAIVSGLASMNSDAHTQALNSVEEFKSHGVEYFVVPFSLGVVQDAPGILRVLHAVIQEFKPNLIHLHSLSVTPYIHLLKIRNKIPFISTCHAQPNPSSINLNLIRLSNKIIPNLFGDRVIAVSSELYQFFEQSLDVPSNRIRRICHGVDQSYFRSPSPEEKIAAKSSLEINITENVVCLIGRLDPQKGHNILIQAMSILENRGIRLTALFAGKDYLDEAQKIQDCANVYDLIDSVKFLGMADSRSVLWASDLLVLPSQTEAFGLVIPEAMMCGIVPVRTPSGGSTDQIKQGVNGFIVPFNDPNSLAEKLQILFMDDNLREEMAQNALNAAKENFTVEVMLQKTINLYKELLNKV